VERLQRSRYPFQLASWYDHGPAKKVEFYKNVVLPLVWLGLGDVNSILSMSVRDMYDLVRIAGMRDVLDSMDKIKGRYSA
jgi:hypothetical protein